MTDNADLVDAARALGRPEVVVTSAFAEGQTANLLVTPDGADLVTHRAVEGRPTVRATSLPRSILAIGLAAKGRADALMRATSAILRLVDLAGGAAELPLAADQGASLPRRRASTSRRPES